ncbi:MAG: hypothetical protein ACON38_07110, partial [Akkermansiaceae bacterium]
MTLSRLIPFLITLAFLQSCEEPGKNPPDSVEIESPDQIVQNLIRSEETVQEITPLLRQLGLRIASESPVGVDLPEEWLSKTKNHKWLSASFGVLAGNFQEGSFVTKTKFEGSLECEDMKRSGLSSKQKLVWTLDHGQWTLQEWISLEVKLLKAPTALFKDVTKSVIPSSFARDDAQRSKHEEITEEALANKNLVMPKREYAD